MASRSFYQFTSSLVPALTYLECHFDVGSSGAVSNTTGNGISSITRLSAGTYKITFQDNYHRFMAFEQSVKAPVTGSAIALTTGLSSGTVYEIVSLGTSTQANFEALGLPAGQTAAAGVSFVATTSSAGTGNGTVKAIGASGVTSCEIVGNPQAMINQRTPQIIVQFKGPTASGDTTPIATDPASGSKVNFAFFMRNSSTKGLGE